LEAKAVEKYIRVSPRKVKYVIDIIKNKPVEQAVGILSLTPKSAAVHIKKAVQSAAANAMENFKEYKVSEDDLYIKEIFVTEGPTLKRFKPRARGRADRVLKRTSHITVCVSDDKNNQSKKADSKIQPKSGKKSANAIDEKAGGKTKEKVKKTSAAAGKENSKTKNRAGSKPQSQVSKKEAKN
jgi:large subunit ribosomal protein L22